MVKKTQKSTTSVVAAERPIWVTSSILDARDNNPSTIKESKLDGVKILFESDVRTVIPTPTEGADWFCEGWTCFYYYPFELGLKYPFPNFVEDLLRAMDVASAQLMPSAWRILACLNAIKEKHHVGVSIGLIRHAFTTKKLSGCRYSLVFKKKDDPLILNLEIVNDRGWKNDFFFAEKNYLGHGGAYLREKWNGEDCTFDSIDADVDAKHVVDKIMVLPVADRLWPNCLNRPIRYATVVNVDDYVDKSRRL